MPVFVLHMHSVCTCCSGLQEMWEGNVLKWGLLSWLRHVGYTVSPIQAWIPKTCHSYAWALHHLRLPFARNLSVGFRPAWLSPPLFSGQPPSIQELKPCVPVEAFLSWGHLDVDGFLEQQQLPGVPGHVNLCGLIPFDGVVVLPCMLRYCRLLQGPFLAGFLVFSQPGLQPSPGLTNVALATITGDSVHHLGLLLHRQRVLHLGQ